MHLLGFSRWVLAIRWMTMVLPALGDETMRPRRPLLTRDKVDDARRVGLGEVLARSCSEG